MESLKNKLLNEYKNKTVIYYNTEIAKNNLHEAKEYLKSSVGKENVNLFCKFDELLNIYHNELVNESFSFIFDYINEKLGLKN